MDTRFGSISYCIYRPSREAPESTIPRTHTTLAKLPLTKGCQPKNDGLTQPVR
jgi:hypothetical protein